MGAAGSRGRFALVRTIGTHLAPRTGKVGGGAILEPLAPETGAKVSFDS